jgi:ribosomal protein L32
MLRAVRGLLFGVEMELLAVPKRKVSVMKRRQRQDGQRRRKNEQYVPYRLCPSCQSAVAPHHVCYRCKKAVL